ncbi:RNA pseudouridine synthase [Luteolibacter ambystomatis]|uniref:RNA pseudouridine synthase n=1 Tax=Luteolibacter ambystomatis TaxID=2824561 RepID=A0A975G8D1_9BACT|nr:RNA pseudouridine synthase [Luteolibacter ambystomatis]QUE50185.1 RNA pseudouridine synthase [Luteolibacter ambystomatis]
MALGFAGNRGKGAAMILHAIADFHVLGESDDWIVVNKPAPLIVHPANGKVEPNLLGGVETLLMYEMENGAALSIITRLDRETSGVVLIAKHRDAARDLSRIFERREARKEYLAIVHGWPKFDTWTSDAPILRAGEVGPSPIWLRQMVHPEGRECETGFWVERRFLREGREFALVRCFPKTGRMHQIRVHLAHSGYPIVGDKLYSGDGAEYMEWMRDDWTPALQERLLLRRHALHAAMLGIPWGGREVAWEAGLAADLAEFMAG